MRSLLLLAVVAALSGCAERGPKKERLAELLHQCRVANRERARLLKVCSCPAEQEFGTIDHGEAGF